MLKWPKWACQDLSALPFFFQFSFQQWLSPTTSNRGVISVSTIKGKCVFSRLIPTAVIINNYCLLTLVSSHTFSFPCFHRTLRSRMFAAVGKGFCPWLGQWSKSEVTVVKQVLMRTGNPLLCVCSGNPARGLICRPPCCLDPSITSLFALYHRH